MQNLPFASTVEKNPQCGQSLKHSLRTYLFFPFTPGSSIPRLHQPMCDGRSCEIYAILSASFIARMERNQSGGALKVTTTNSRVVRVGSSAGVVVWEVLGL
jgi:hypothetical protein